MKPIKKTARFLQRMRDIANECDTDLDHSEILAVGSALLLFTGILIYVLYAFLS